MQYNAGSESTPSCTFSQTNSLATGTEQISKEQIMTKAKSVIWVLVLIGLATVGASICYAELKDESEYPKECVAMFKEMDKDGNGQITIEEFVIAAQPPTYAGRKTSKEAFVRTDKNADGVLTMDEFCEVKELKEGEKELTPEEQCEELFKKYDTDHNGKLSLTEFFVGANTQSYGSRKASKDTFLIMDKNHDEELTQEEFCATVESPPAE
jgi:Ca2+-binding EF-hand superfamily protein